MSNRSSIEGVEILLFWIRKNGVKTVLYQGGSSLQMSSKKTHVVRLDMLVHRILPLCAKKRGTCLYGSKICLSLTRPR